MVQGALGDCFFLAACSVLASRPARVSGMFLGDYDADGARGGEHGVVGARFFHDGRWVSVLCDDALPCVAATGVPAFARVPRAPDGTAVLWVALLEKCYARLHGGYDFICGGNVSEALRDLTGV